MRLVQQLVAVTRGGGRDGENASRKGRREKYFVGERALGLAHPFIFFFRLTPGRSPLVNSTPTASNTRRIASIVELFTGSPPSIRVTVFGETFALSATSRTDSLTAARAMRA